MEFGMFHEFYGVEGKSQTEAFANAFAEIDVAEALGLDVIWLSELHMNARSVLSAPLTVASAIAARTRRIRIGTAVHVLPLSHPIRIAEEAATVDQISRGRLIFGVGRSGFARSYEAYGVPYAQSRERFTEQLEMIKLAWTRPSFSYEGKYYRCGNVSLTPRPCQVPHPPIRVAVNSLDTFISVGTIGDPVMIAGRIGAVAELAPNVQAYRAAYEAAGHEGRGQVYLRIPVYVGETEEAARAEPEASIMEFYRFLGGQMAASAGGPGAVASENRAERGRNLQTIAYDEVLRDKIVVGTPGRVVDRLLELQEELGLDGILAEMNCGGRIPHERVMKCLRLFCEQVMPRMR